MPKEEVFPLMAKVERDRLVMPRLGSPPNNGDFHNLQLTQSYPNKKPEIGPACLGQHHVRVNAEAKIGCLGFRV